MGTITFRDDIVGLFDIIELQMRSTWLTMGSTVEVPITDYLRDSAPNLEKYKAVQNFPV